MTQHLLTSINPATGEMLGHVPIAGRAEVDAAVATASVAQREWAALSGTERGRVLRRAADLLRARNDELARLETQDTGKPLQETLVVDVASGADCLEYYAGLAATISGEHIDLGPSAFGYTRREPLGVVAGIGAWNYPLQIACWKSAPALACGNAMIFKPAELTPLTAVQLAKVYEDAGLPKGIFQVVQGRAETGSLLSKHPGIRKISLTGSVGTGRAVVGFNQQMPVGDAAHFSCAAGFETGRRTVEHQNGVWLIKPLVAFLRIRQILPLQRRDRRFSFAD